MTMMVRMLVNSMRTHKALLNMCIPFLFIHSKLADIKALPNRSAYFSGRKTSSPLLNSLTSSIRAAGVSFGLRGMKNYKAEMAFYDLLAQPDSGETNSGG